MQVTGMKPKEVIELKKVLLVQSSPPENTLPEDGLYHYLLQARKEHDDKHKSATSLRRLTD